MTHKIGNQQDQRRGEELRLLAEVAESLDEMFQPYLAAASTARQPQTALPAFIESSKPAGKMTGQMFEVVLRSFANLWPMSEALTPRPPAPPPESFARTVVPRAAVAAAQPLPHEVREELLELRTEVMHAARTRRLQTLMLCGVEAGAGTSFVAHQLSRLLAEYAPLKVAFLTLVSGQEKKPKRPPQAAAPPRLQFLLRRTELPNLTEIASANGTISLTELLCHCSTPEVLRQIKAEFDLLVIDAPAIALYGEAALLAALMDGVILVAEPHVTPLRRMDRAERRLQKARAHVLGMVLNRQRRL
jgi:Mrp family chromosome partitioning ATPase